MTHEESQLWQLLQQAKHAVFFGGAGVSTESGIPDFRSPQGIYQAEQTFGVRPETILSHSFFMDHPGAFYRFYKTMMLYPSALPNPAHQALAKWEQAGIIKTIITQNIDQLHQKAGSQKVLELHGSVYRNHCLQCGRFYDLEQLLGLGEVPLCPVCQGLIKPDVVLYEEALDADVIEQTVQEIQQADLLIVGGTSLNVYPAAGFLRVFHGKHLVLINREPTAWDGAAHLIIRSPIGATFETILKQI